MEHKKSKKFEVIFKKTAEAANFESLYNSVIITQGMSNRLQSQTHLSE